MSKIGITFSVYNRLEFTIQCIKSIVENDCKHELLIVVVNNGSTDNTYEVIKKEFPDVVIINNKENMGCAISWNQGLSYCYDQKCDFLVLTQNDIIISKGVLNNSVDFLLNSDENVKIVSPVAINVPFMSNKIIEQNKLNEISEITKEKYKGSRHCNFIIYFGMMFPEVFEKCKFDEKYRKALYEDSDFYRNLAINRIPHATSIDIGLMFHRYNTTQIIANNSSIVENRVYFDKKWEDSIDKVNEGSSFLSGSVTTNITYPHDNFLFLNVEESGLHQW